MNKKENKSKSVVKSSVVPDNNLNLSLTINTDSPDLVDFITVWKDFGCRPNKHTLFTTVNQSDLFKILDDSVHITGVSETYVYEDNEVTNSKYLAKLDDNTWISFLSMDMEDGGFMCQDINIFYKTTDAKSVLNINDLIDSIMDLSSIESGGEEEELEHKPNTFITSLGENGVEFHPTHFTKIDVDNIQMYYNEKLFKSVKKLIKKLKSVNGLLLISGERGCGKTSLVSYISKNVERNFINIPINMIDSTLSNPQFRNTLKVMGKVTLVIEDCEFLFNNPIGGGTVFISNILQLVDGLSSSDIDLQVIITSNEKEIDNDLLDSNNLIDNIVVDELDTDESNDLSKHLKIDKKYKSPTKLIDVVRGRGIKETVDIGF